MFVHNVSSMLVAWLLYVVTHFRRSCGITLVFSVSYPDGSPSSHASSWSNHPSSSTARSSGITGRTINNTNPLPTCRFLTAPLGLVRTRLTSMFLPTSGRCLYYLWTLLCHTCPDQYWFVTFATASSPTHAATCAVRSSSIRFLS